MRTEDKLAGSSAFGRYEERHGNQYATYLFNYTSFTLHKVLTFSVFFLNVMFHRYDTHGTHILSVCIVLRSLRRVN